MADYKKVMDLDYELRKAMNRLDVEKVKAVLANCGTDAARVVSRYVYWTNEKIDFLLVYPLCIEYGKKLNQDDVKNIKEIFKLMLDCAPPQLCHSNPQYIMNKFANAQKRFADTPGVGFQDLIEEFKVNSDQTAQDSLVDNKSNWKKIALVGVAELCVVGAVVAHVLAYPVTALVLAVSSAVTLMGVGIAKVLENPSVKKLFTRQQEVSYNIIPASCP